MLRFRGALFFGFVTALVGLIMSVLPARHAIDDDAGLYVLFKLRGTRPPPQEVVIISLDKVSAANLQISDEPNKWPRTLHTQLTQTLSQKGASVIAFDLFFQEERSDQDDQAFAEAIASAGNVVLSGYLKREPIIDEQGNTVKGLHIEKHVMPTARLAEAAASVSCFILPKESANVGKYWLFKTSAGHIPTLPVVILQLYALDAYSDLFRMITKHRPDLSNRLPSGSQQILLKRDTNRIVELLRDMLQQNPDLAEDLLNEIDRSGPPQYKNVLKSLVTAYQSPSSRHINFYGPPRTITTIPYYQMINDPGPAARNTDFRGKAVFIGVSENIPTERRYDTYRTFFSRADGVHLSGVEIAATAFANLLDQKGIRHMDNLYYFILVLVFGFALGTLCRLTPPIVSLVSVLALSAIYLFIAVYQFRTEDIALPIAIPLSVQAPFAFLGAIVWKYALSNKTINSFLPREIARRISSGDRLSDVETVSQNVQGVCLLTDIQGFTKISETLSTDEVKKLKQAYFNSVFKSLRQQLLLIEKSTGDGIVAAWEDNGGSQVKKQACLTALEIREASQQFNKKSHVAFRTRIGLHCGPISLGIVSAARHHEYDLSGDTVNTTQKIESLNKYFDTHILVSEEVLQQSSGFLTRKIGIFIPPGKSKPIMIHELLCQAAQASEKQSEFCSIFADALNTFSTQQWKDAGSKFERIINIFGYDGPSHYYEGLCRQYISHPPDKDWNGSINLNIENVYTFSNQGLSEV